MDTERAHADRDLVLPYPDTGHRVGQNVFVVVFFGVVLSGPLIGLYAWSQTSGCWPMLVWFGGLGVGCAHMFVRAIVTVVVTGRRQARGDGWLHLSRTGFEVHSRTGKLRRYEWREIDEFMLVESRDDEGGVVTDVGYRYSPERRRTAADKLRSALALQRGRDGSKSDGVLNGQWDRPIDETVDLMNGWLARCRRESVNRARKLGIGGRAHSLPATAAPSWSDDRHDGVSKARVSPT